MVRCHFGAPVQFGFENWRMEGDAVAMDLSETGLSMDLESALPVHTKVRLSFTLINEYAADEAGRRRQFELGGEVRDCRESADKSYRVGIRFTQVPEADRAFIAAYVRGQSS